MTEREILERLAEHIKGIAPSMKIANTTVFNCKGCLQGRLTDMWAVSLGMCHECCNRIASALTKQAEKEGGK